MTGHRWYVLYMPAGHEGYIARTIYIRPIGVSYSAAFYVKDLSQLNTPYLVRVKPH